MSYITKFATPYSLTFPNGGMYSSQVDFPGKYKRDVALMKAGCEFKAEYLYNLLLQVLPGVPYELIDIIACMSCSITAYNILTRCAKLEDDLMIKNMDWLEAIQVEDYNDGMYELSCNGIKGNEIVEFITNTGEEVDDSVFKVMGLITGEIYVSYANKRTHKIINRSPLEVQCK